MKTLEQTKNALDHAGLCVEWITINPNPGDTETRRAIRVVHGYNGLNPDDDARRAAATAERIAAKNGRISERRGHGTATWIY